MKIKLSKTDDGWRWRIHTANGHAIATSETYPTKAEANETLKPLTAALRDAKVKYTVVD